MRPDLALFRAAALDDDRLTRADLKVLWHLGRFADFRTGWAHPSLQQIAKSAGISKPTAIKAITRLCDCGYLTRRSTTKPDGSAGVNFYMVLLDPADAHDPISVPTIPEGSKAELPTTGGGKDLTGFPADFKQVGSQPSPSEVVDHPSKAPLSEAVDRNTQRTPSNDGVVVKKRTTWLTPYCETWEAVMRGPPNAPMLARELKPAHDLMGVQRLNPAFRRYLTEMVSTGKAQFVSVAKFATSAGLYESAPAGSSRYGGLSDEPELVFLDELPGRSNGAH